MRGWFLLNLTENIFFFFFNGGVGPKILFFNYWNDVVLDSVETYFLEVRVYVSLKRATTGL